MSTRRTETSPVGPSRHRNSGPGRLLIAVYGIFALAAGVYVLATVSLAMPGRRWYWISVGAVGLELVGVLTIGLFSLLDPEAFPNDTVWSLFGRGYGFVPLLLPVLGLWWLYLNRRGRAAEPATERASPTA